MDRVPFSYVHRQWEHDDLVVVMAEGVEQGFTQS